MYRPCLLEESLYFINTNLLPPWQLFCFLLLTWPHDPQGAAVVAPEWLIYSSPDWLTIRQPPPDWSGSALGCWSADAALHNLSWSNMVQRKSMFQPYHSFLLKKQHILNVVYSKWGLPQYFNSSNGIQLSSFRFGSFFLLFSKQIYSVYFPRPSGSLLA